MRNRLLTASLVVALAACSSPSTEPTSAPQPAATSATVSETLQAQSTMFAEYWEERLQRMPLLATQIGDRRYNDQLPNMFSPDYREESQRWTRDWLARAQTTDASTLTGQAALSQKIFVGMLQGQIDGFEHPQHLMPLNQFYSVPNQLVMLGSGKGAQPFVTVEDHDNWLSRAAKIPALLMQMTDNMREGMEKGIVQPRVLMEKVLPQLDAVIKDAPEDTLFWQPVAALSDDIPAAEQERLRDAYRTLIAEQLMPAYREVRRFVADDYLPATRETVGLSALPGGDEWYAYRVRESTTTSLTPDEIHQIGLDEVARIHGEMRKLQAELGVEGDLQALFAHVKSMPNATFETEEALLTAYRDFRATVDPLLPALFDIEPKADFEIRPVEAFRAASASGGSYQRPAQDGSRPGIFYVNTYDLSARPRSALESLYLHEAAPGHHFQLALQQELSDIPTFRRFGSETAFSEGWGLYAESLGKELGVYTDPVMYFGALDAELWRSIRLVVDTGIHAKGWTRQQVLDYMYANSPAEPTRAISEAERFMAIPGQALAYKIGQLKIRALRERAEQALGADFDVRGFHREVLRDGSLPLDILEQKVDRWIAEQQADQPAAAA